MDVTTTKRLRWAVGAPAVANDEAHSVCVVGFGDGHAAAMVLAEASRAGETPAVLAFDLMDTGASAVSAEYLEKQSVHIPRRRLACVHERPRCTGSPSSFA